MNLKINKIFLALFICLTLLFILCLKVDAASATITVDKSTVEVGNPVKITVSGKGVQWNLKLKVDGEVLKTDSELENYEANKNISFSTTYTPKNAGTKEITLEGSVTEFSDGSTIKDFSSESKSITVKEKETTTDKKEEDKTTEKDTTTDKKEETTQEQPKEKSNNAYLKTLGVRISDSLAKELGVKTNEYDFSGFSKDKTSYNVTVPKNVDSLKVVATAGENGTVKVTGNSGFEVGSNNKITIKVTSENGKTTKTYTIKVTKLAEEEEKPGNLIEDDEELYLTSLEITGVDISPKFSKDTYSYTANVSSDTTEINIKAVANNEKAKVEISGNKELIEGENTVNILLTLDTSEEQAVYQIVVTKEEATGIVTMPDNSENVQTTTTDLIGNLKNYIGIAIAIFALIIITIIVLIILLRKENKRLNEEDEKIDKTNNREYDVYKNDENEFTNNEIEKDNFIESLYKQRNGTLDEEDLTQEEKETLEEINKQTEKIFTEKVEGQSVEYSKNEFIDENPLEVRRKRRGKGKHSL